MISFFDSEAYDNLKARVDNLSGEAEHQWGAMTMHQAVCHMTDPVRDVLGLRHVVPIVPEENRPQMIAMVLCEQDWPHDQPTAPQYFQGEDGGGTRPGEFERDKLTFLTLLEQLYNTPEDYSYKPHAVLGYLTRKQVGQLVWKHTDYHLRQFNS